MLHQYYKSLVYYNIVPSLVNVASLRVVGVTDVAVIEELEWCRMMIGSLEYSMSYINHII